MTYFLLSVTNRCNKNCSYCVVKPWLNNPAYPDKAAAMDFIGFLSREAEENDVVEITGGEPTLFEGLSNILNLCREKRLRVILRTNGAGLGAWRKQYENMIVVLARHGTDCESFGKMKSHLLPWDLAKDGIPEHIKQKERDRPVFANDETSPLASHPFRRMFFAVNDGTVKFCPPGEKTGTLRECKPRRYHCCQSCPYMLGAWNLIWRLNNREHDR